GLLLQAAKELSIDLSRSFMIGDRLTDIIAGAKAGVRTILVLTGKHLAPLIQTSEPIDTTMKPDYIAADLNAAAEWILARTDTPRINMDLHGSPRFTEGNEGNEEQRR